MRKSESFTASLLHYARVFLVQTSQTALANGRGKLDERLARWLLMWDDRVFDAGATITHDFLALLLGVTRPGVTIALHELEGKGLIRSTRSHVRILDRDGLRRAANGFYGVPEAEYERSIGQPSGEISREICNPPHDPPPRRCRSANDIDPVTGNGSATGRLVRRDIQHTVSPRDRRLNPLFDFRQCGSGGQRTSACPALPVRAPLDRRLRWQPKGEKQQASNPKVARARMVGAVREDRR